MFYWRRGSLLRKFKLGLIHGEGDGEGDKGGGGGGDTGVPEWAKDLPESVRGWDEVKNSDTAEKFYDQMANQRSRMGRSITIPGDDAGDEDRQAFHKKLMDKVPALMPTPNLEDPETMNAVYSSLGRPEKAENYEIPKIEGANMEQAEAFRGIAHKYGLNPTQFTGIISEITAGNLAQNESVLTANKAAHVELKKEWGSDYDRRMSLAANIAKLTDAPAGITKALKDGHGSPADYKWFHNLAQKFKGEGKNLLDDIPAGNPKMTPEEASAKIKEIQGNKQHAYWKKSDPGHKDAMAKMRELYKLKIPEG